MGKKKRFGFTLAEVLITLGIIGLVAALVLPMLVQNYHKKIYVEKFKETYSSLNQAINLMANDLNCSGDSLCLARNYEFLGGEDMDGDGYIDPNPANGESWIDYDVLSFAKDLSKYFKVIKSCENSPNCTPQKMYITLSKSSPVPEAFRFSYVFVLADGTIVAYNQPEGSFYVDINGLTPPNITGRDIFLLKPSFLMLAGISDPTKCPRTPQFLPVGGKFCGKDVILHWKGTDGIIGPCYRKNYGAPKNADGRFCAGRIIEEGWEMNY